MCNAQLLGGQLRWGPPRNNENGPTHAAQQRWPPVWLS
jgi:hypothetical protein